MRMPLRRLKFYLLLLLLINISCRKSKLTYETENVSNGDIVVTITATGTINPKASILVGSQVSGILQKIFVDFNSPVKKGQCIAKLDPAIFLAARDQAKANLSVAEGNLQKAIAQFENSESAYKRYSALSKDGLVSVDEVEKSLMELRSSRALKKSAIASVEQAKAALRQSEVNLQHTIIISPVDGIVISKSIDVGQTVAASLQAPTLFTIAEDISKMQVDANINEADIGGLKEGQKAFFTVDAFLDKKFEGIITQIRNSPQIIQNVVTYDAVVDVENSEGKLRPGMTATVTIPIENKKGVLRIPNGALRFSPAWAEKHKSSNTDPSRQRVYILKDRKPHPVEITTGISDGKFTEVKYGELHIDDKVIIESIGEDSKSSQRPRGFGRPM